MVILGDAVSNATLSPEMELLLFNSFSKFKPIGRRRVVNLQKALKHVNSQLSVPITQDDLWRVFEDLFNVDELNSLYDSSDNETNEELLESKIELSRIRSRLSENTESNDSGGEEQLHALSSKQQSRRQKRGKTEHDQGIHSSPYQSDDKFDKNNLDSTSKRSRKGVLPIQESIETKGNRLNIGDRFTAGVVQQTLKKDELSSKETSARIANRRRRH